VAAVTAHVDVRAGSVVLPLHSVVRVAEEWAVVDNISGGRVGIACASGWHPDDFVLAPLNHAGARERLPEDIATLRRLWRGESVSLPGPDGRSVDVRTLPRPVQPELPVWVTSAGNIDTFRSAGEMGANILTHLLGQSVEAVAEKIEAYRAAWRRAGHAGRGTVTLMLHTFVGDDEAEVRELAREPMKRYLRASVSLIKDVASAFPAFRSTTGEAVDRAFADLAEEDVDALLNFAFERYYNTSALLGSVESCARMVTRLRGTGIDEIACLIDFGLDTDTVLSHLEQLTALKDSFALGDRPDDHAPANEGIGALIRREGVTHLQCTPTMAKMLMLDAEARDGLAQLAIMMVGGEALPPALASDLLGAVGGRLENMYGPTETTIWSSTSTVRAGEPISIGHPIANTQLYVLDEDRRPVASGRAGELWIGGEGVARGYLHAEDLSAERFVRDPFVANATARMYRTGDLVRHAEGDRLEFLGRTDQQVKVRGHRIELGEIEARLVAHPGIADAVVVAQTDALGDLRLAAFVIATAQMPSTATLKEHLRGALPEYMLPAHFVSVTEFPRTPNQKVDRNAFPSAAEAASLEVGTPYVAPESPVEAVVVRAWEGLLGTPRVGLDDNFFELGGDSLMVVRLHRRLEEALETEIAFASLFRFPTVRGFVAHGLGGAAVGTEGSTITGAASAQQRAAARRQVRTRRS
jgi:natural product biosynthesis luciferase-like monooxygenase protein